jgi:hypothetical protein
MSDAAKSTMPDDNAVSGEMRHHSIVVVSLHLLPLHTARIGRRIW